MAIVKARSKAGRWVLGLLLAASGCGFEGELPTPGTPPTPPVPPARAAVALSLSASPIEAAVEGGGSWSAQWTLAIQETSGIGGAIDSVRATLTEPTGGSIAETELDADSVSAQLGGSNHIRGGSSQKILMSLGFDFPTGAPSGNLHVALRMSDDRGNPVAAAVDDVIQVCVPRLLTPAERAVLDNGCSNGQNGVFWEFDWSECAGADFYQFYARQRSAQEPLFDRSQLTDSSFTTLSDRIVPEEARLGWFWRVRASINGVWGDWSPERDFDVEPVNADCVRP